MMSGFADHGTDVTVFAIKPTFDGWQINGDGDYYDQFLDARRAIVNHCECEGITDYRITLDIQAQMGAMSIVICEHDLRGGWEGRVKAALNFLEQGVPDGDHHKTWIIDQVSPHSDRMPDRISATLKT